MKIHSRTLSGPMRGPWRAAILGAMSALALLGGGCRGERSEKPPRQFFPDLDTQPKYQPQDTSTFFAEYTDPETGARYGRSMREPPAGTVAYGRHVSPVGFAGKDFADRAFFLKDGRAFYQGKEPALDAAGAVVREPDGSVREAYVERIPIEVTPELLAIGQQQYNIYCIVCHGGTGDGKGTVGSRWSYPLPAFTAEAYRRGGEKGQDGYLFHTIRNGVANVGDNVPFALKMPSYASKVSELESWAIVAHIRALQAASAAPLDAVPERDRLELERRRAVSPQAMGTPAPGGKERGS